MKHDFLHDTFQYGNAKGNEFYVRIKKQCTQANFYAIISFFAAVAQLDRVLGYEPRGRGFDSCQPRHYLKRVSVKSTNPFSFV